jgi:hypothetical protein
MKSLVAKLITASGYDSVNHFVDSTFHPKLFTLSAGTSACLGTLAYLFDHIFGISWIVGLVLVLLFTIELYTGVKAAKKDGFKFDSEKFGKGWIKLLIYMIMIGSSNLLAIYVPVKPIFGWDFNIYEWLHYGFYNFALINLFWSNLENFIRLGWDEYLPLLNKLKPYVKQENKNESED